MLPVTVGERSVGSNCVTPQRSSGAGTAADALHSEKMQAVEGHLWLFAVLGTLLSVTQLLVYATLARQGRRSIHLVWAALVVSVVAGSVATTPTQLLGVMIGVTAVLTSALVAISLRSDSTERSVGGVVPAAPRAD